MRKFILAPLILGLSVACGDDTTSDAGPAVGLDAGFADTGSSIDAEVSDTGMPMDAGTSDSGTMAGAVSYLHGVASGDPLASQVILWTRVTPADASLLEVTVAWELASDSGFADVVRSGMTTTSTAIDLTVKVDVTGLSPGTPYWYRFTAMGVTSPVGRTKTLPMGPVDRLRFAVVSCSHYAAGFFNVYRLIANRSTAENDLDAVIHLGDYFYEYGAGGFGDNGIAGRAPIPDIETIDLAAYRARHAQYKSDPDLQAMHATHPMIAVWDDHESANDAWAEGAENHTPGMPPMGEGAWDARKAEAIQAYYEWMPIRTPAMGGAIFRRFEFGELATLHMVDTRLEGRVEQIDIASYFGDEGFDTPTFLGDFLDPQRTLLGAAQEQWLSQGLSAATTTWQVLGNQVMMGQLYTPSIPNPGMDPNIAAANQVAALGDQLVMAGLIPGPGLPFNFDAWGGYVTARERLFGTLAAIRNPIVVTGDFHNAWAVELTRDADLNEGGAYDPATSAGTVGVEFVTSSVTSPGFEAALPDAFLDPLLGFIGMKNPHIKYADLRQRGFLSLELSGTEARAQFIFTPSIMTASEMEAPGPVFTVAEGSKRMVQE